MLAAGWLAICRPLLFESLDSEYKTTPLFLTDSLGKKTSDSVIYLAQYDTFVGHVSGWYRLFIGNSSVRMPERCIESHMCGTDAPLWLRSPHPLESEGIVRAEVCGSWEEGCCQFHSNLIHVKACPRNYYVYKFVSPNLCRLAYCAGKEQVFIVWSYTV
uniref:UMOD/GP2/OIT3-like D8C domain-containing protein n=1 Tax=Sander lucioperca TaxID=283035 RepID=A0A8C9XDA3_SANLU